MLRFWLDSDDSGGQAWFRSAEWLRVGMFSSPPLYLAQNIHNIGLRRVSRHVTKKAPADWPGLLLAVLSIAERLG